MTLRTSPEHACAAATRWAMPAPVRTGSQGAPILGDARARCRTTASAFATLPDSRARRSESSGGCTTMRATACAPRDGRAGTTTERGVRSRPSTASAGACATTRRARRIAWSAQRRPGPGTSKGGTSGGAGVTEDASACAQTRVRRALTSPTPERSYKAPYSRTPATAEGATRLTTTA